MSSAERHGVFFPHSLEVGQSLLPFGQGAKNGALVFLGIPLKTGKDSGFYYKRCLPSMWREWWSSSKVFFDVKFFFNDLGEEVVYQVTNGTAAHTVEAYILQTIVNFQTKHECT